MDYPFQLPEARATEEFLAAHPNIAGVQTYHNNGGMILEARARPGTGTIRARTSRSTTRSARTGERILPWYEYLIIWQGLYTVHGGAIDWTSDGHGIVSFSNELWNGNQYFQSPLLGASSRATPTRPSRDSVSVTSSTTSWSTATNFSDWKPFNHPRIRRGGDGWDWDKLTSRVNPRFMSMELFHRNMAFTLYHADMTAHHEDGGDPGGEPGWGHVQGPGGHHQRAPGPHHHRPGP